MDTRHSVCALDCPDACSLLVNVDNGAASTMTAIMGRMATYSGKKVEWDAALNSQIDLMPERFAFDAEPRNLPLPDGSYAIPVPGVTKAV